MRIETKPILSLLTILMLISSVTGVKAQQNIEITIKSAVEIALKNNIDLKRNENQVLTSEIAVNQEKADFYPNFSANASTSQKYGQSFDMTIGQLESQDSHSLNAGLSASINLFNGFSDIASYQKAIYDLRSEESSFVRQQETVMLNAVSGIIQIMLDTELITIQRENLQSQNQLLLQIDAFYQAGNRPVSDLLQQQASIAQAEYNVITAERNLAVGEQQLIQTLGLMPGDKYEFILPAIEDRLSEKIEYDYTSCYRTAINSRSDMLSQQYKINSSSKQIDVAQSGYWPSVSLSMSMQSNYSSLSQFSFYDQFTDINPYKTIGLSVSIPIFDQNRTKNNIKKAEISVESERLNENKLSQQIAFEVKQSILDFESLYKQLQAAVKQREFTEEALNAEQERYNVGASTIIELTQTRSRFVEAASNEARAKMNLLMQRILVAYYQGNIESEINTVFSLM